MLKRLGVIKGYKYKTSSWHLNGFPDGNNTKQYNVREKPTVILYTFVVVYLTLTDPLRIQPWSQDRRNQTKSNRKYVRR